MRTNMLTLPCYANTQSKRKVETGNEAAGFKGYCDFGVGEWKPKGCPAKIKTATKSQVANWPELTAYKNDRFTPSLLWVRVTERKDQ